MSKRTAWTLIVVVVELAVGLVGGRKDADSLATRRPSYRMAVSTLNNRVAAYPGSRA
jgi:hypothetical protein